jgi:curved DNA-binding protein CbpA
VNDPYDIIGVSRNAGDDEIDAAYRALAKSYHPDYTSHDIATAETRMRVIDDAYDAIMAERVKRSAPQQPSGDNTAKTHFRAVRQAINTGNIDMADRMLDGVSLHEAEWHYLKGCVYRARGWYDEAQRQFDTACEMQSNDVEYAQAADKLRNAGQRHRDPSGDARTGACGGDLCDCCTTLLCLNCFCNCIGCGSRRKTDC